MRLVSIRRCACIAVVVTLIGPAALFAAGEAETGEVDLYAAYPERPVTIIVPFAAGGGTDVIFRAVASVIEEYWGQPLVVVNRPGSGGTVGANFAANADPDGYTLFASLQGPLILNPLQLEVDYDASDFDHVVQLVSNPLTLVGSIDSGFENALDLIDAARADPGALTIGTTGVGNLPQLMTLRLQQLTGIDIALLPLQGSAPATRETMAGTIVGFINTDVAAVIEGSVQGLAVLSTERYLSIPDVPTFAELGLPEMQADVWFGVSVPTGVPADIQRKIADTMERVAADPTFAETMSNIGNNILFLGPEAFSAKVDELAAFFPGFLSDMGMLP